MIELQFRAWWAFKRALKGPYYPWLYKMCSHIAAVLVVQCFIAMVLMYAVAGDFASSGLSYRWAYVTSITFFLLAFKWVLKYVPSR